MYTFYPNTTSFSHLNGKLRNEQTKEQTPPQTFGKRLLELLKLMSSQANSVLKRRLQFTSIFTFYLEVTVRDHLKNMLNIHTVMIVLKSGFHTTPFCCLDEVYHLTNSIAKDHFKYKELCNVYMKMFGSIHCVFEVTASAELKTHRWNCECNSFSVFREANSSCAFWR